MYSIFILLTFLMGRTWAYPTTPCPTDWSEQGVFNDIVTLTDVVSWNDGYENITGVCKTYSCIYEKDGVYDTRMRIYKDVGASDLIIVFRPTQQTPDGGDIHNGRQLVPCNFLNGSCDGLVDDRFQRAFNSFTEDKSLLALLESYKNNTISIAGHSLGGAFVIFMGLYLEHVVSKTPTFMLGLAGPFIGDDVFSATYQTPLHTKLQDKWFQVESINQYNPSEFDGTVEGYNVDHAPFLYIYPEVICGLKIPKLANSYGMHDLRNYHLFFEGQQCL